MDACCSRVEHVSFILSMVMCVLTLSDLIVAHYLHAWMHRQNLFDPLWGTFQHLKLTHCADQWSGRNWSSQDVLILRASMVSVRAFLSIWQHE